MNAPQQIDQQTAGLYHKFHVTRTDGDPKGKHANDQYFVLNLTTDKHAIPAIVAYAESCETEYPALASDLKAGIANAVKAGNEMVNVPETTLPNGTIVPAFRVGKFISSRGAGGIVAINGTDQPWIRINFDESKAAAEQSGYRLITETQALAIAHDIASQDINWSGGKVGEGHIYQGLHKGNVSAGQPGNVKSTDPEERRWHQLSNGERIHDFAGNLYTWVLDDVQGNERGLTGRIAEDSPSITTAPYPSEEKGMGWRPDGARDWSGNALFRGGRWHSGSDAGVFALDDDRPGGRGGSVGFRCTE